MRLKERDIPEFTPKSVRHVCLTLFGWDVRI
jgi:hypothetical protein